ncbi:hypothetical protein BOW51_08210 [Solemya velesiana gill symbiont]|uniref:Thymidine phosphorylase n=2 Tax=Solemya velesiana gill symbiont TaxID=1918948 RepID=A0A1T2KTP0_9GAMM|nr:hypothetical protein BOW51_08210 [Solemya velesiana gill symbiont]
MTEMFEQMEPAMLDFAEMAETNQSQLRFVEAINIVKAQRESVEHKFREEITRGFKEFLQGKPITYPVDVVEKNAQIELDIVEYDDLEQRIAIQNIVSKAHNKWFKEIYALRQRLSMLRGGKKLPEEDIPAGPAHIASAFQIASDLFDLEQDKLLILYALFDKFVLTESGTIFESINSRLIDAGIFPNFKVDIEINPRTGEIREKKKTGSGFEPSAKEAAGGTGKGKGEGEGGGSQSLGDELFDNIRSMLKSKRKSDPRYKDHPDFNPAAANVQMIETPALASAITNVQPKQSASYLPEANSEGELPQTVELDQNLIQEVRQTLVAERERLFTEVDRNKIPSADLDTIEMVGMLFEEVLNEKHLPNIAKALISHLHTPILKVAVIDHKFLVDNSHISRRLINLMVDSGTQWIDEEDLRKGIYYPMQDLIKKILAKFKEDNLGVFDEAYESLDKRISDLVQKAHIVETRTQEASRGRERLESARSRAHHAIEKKLGDRSIPHALDRFLNHAWLDKLILMLLRDPDVEQTREWSDAMVVVDKVIWCFDACTDPETHGQLPIAIKELKTLVEEGLMTLGEYHQPDSDELFSMLQSYADKTVEEAAPSIRKDAKDAASPKAVARTRSKPLSGKEKEILEELKELEFGTWFELDDTSGNSYRVKLSWLSPVTRKCMFVDSSGVQSSVIPIDSLARKMGAGQARVIEQHKVPFVDRAMETIKNILGKALGIQQAPA